MLTPQQARELLSENIDDSRVDDMVTAEFGIINIPALSMALDLPAPQDTAFDGTIGPATPPNVRNYENVDSSEHSYGNWHSLGTPYAGASRGLRRSSRMTQSQASMASAFDADSPNFKQDECEVSIDPSLAPDDYANIDSNPSTSGSDGLFFTSLDAAIAAIPTPDWLCPRNDPSIPNNDTDRQTWVLHLVNAINNTIDVVDQPSRAFNKHWKSNPPFYHPAAIELTAWDILALAEAMHTTGPVVLQILDARQTEEVRRTRDWSFAQRILSIIALLRMSKSRCENCLNKVNVPMVVGNPEKLLQGSRGNSVQNKKRQVLLENGREMRKKRKIEGGTVDENVEEGT